MTSHEFGVMHDFEYGVWYVEYEPEKYGCISVHMHSLDFVLDNYSDELNKIKTYVCTSLQPFYGIDESAITIFPPESLEALKNVVNEANLKLNSGELCKLLLKIDEAVKRNMHLIHFGI